MPWRPVRIRKSVARFVFLLESLSLVLYYKCYNQSIKMKAKNTRVVVVGGGTGTYTVLTGLKAHQLRLTAVVSMADSGGSTGRLRDEFGVLPPGDVRRALLALSSSEEQALLRKLFEYRFENGSAGSPLKGHSFGNLFLTALTAVVGSDVGAIQEAGKLLNIQGKVLPVTLDNSHLVARLEDGTLVRGETNIDIRRVRPDLRILDVFLDPPAKVYKEVAGEIKRADLVVIGPGDLYTSIIPNLLVSGIANALGNTKAKVVYVCNIMNKHGETDNFTVSSYVSEINKYLGGQLIDVAIVNKSSYPKRLLAKYAKLDEAYPVEMDNKKVKAQVGKVISGDFTTAGTLLRHDPDKLARAIVSLL